MGDRSGRGMPQRLMSQFENRLSSSSKGMQIEYQGGTREYLLLTRILLKSFEIVARSSG